MTKAATVDEITKGFTFQMIPNINGDTCTQLHSTSLSFPHILRAMEPPYLALTTTGFLVVAMFSGLLSTFLSAIILNTIRLSPDKLSTNCKYYHHDVIIRYQFAPLLYKNNDADKSVGEILTDKELNRPSLRENQISW